MNFWERICYVLSEEMFEVFLPYGPMLTKREKNRKQKKNGLEIWWKGTFLPNLALICLMGSEKTGFMDGWQMDDGRPHNGSSSAVQ